MASHKVKESIPCGTLYSMNEYSLSLDILEREIDMDILIVIAVSLAIIIPLTCKMITGLKAYNQALRLQARADYYQARIERSCKQYHIR